MDKIYIYRGTDKRFDNVIDSLKNTMSLNQVLDYINKSSDKSRDSDEVPIIDCLVIKSNDYGAIKEWALMNFSNSILLNCNILVKNLYINNPPDIMYKNIKDVFQLEIIEENLIEYQKPNIDNLQNFVKEYDNYIIGQKHVCNLIASTIYSSKYKRQKPITILFLGESGVGKTETAKYIHNCFGEGDELFRVQFSMQQTNDAHKFIFGSNHGEDSFAKNLMKRTSNVVLLDEFDKVPQNFYNAFYQMFDEGVFVDSNYTVDVSDCIIICTSNFLNENDAEKYLGSPIYSRFSKIITFKNISIEDKIIIANKIYQNIIAKLDDDDLESIKNNKVLDVFVSAIKEKNLYKNIRMLNNDIEDAVYFEILKAKNIII